MLAVLHGCAAGPDVKRPEASLATQVQPDESRKPVSARDISSEWWLLFKSQPISEHIKLAFKANPNTEAALATIRLAQEHSVIRQGFFYSGTGGDNSTLPGSPVQPGSANAYYNLHTAQLTVGYEPEVLAIDRRLAGLTQNLVEAQQEAAFFTLASNVAAVAIQESSLRVQIEAQLYIVGLNRQALEIVRNQFKLGYVSEKDVTQRELEAAQAQQALVPLQQRFEQTRDLVLILEGNVPHPDGDTDDVFRLEELRLSKELPLSLSSRLVEQRPDVRIAEAQLRAAGEKYGVEVVNTLPRFTVTAAAGNHDSSSAWMLRDGGRFFEPNGNAAQFIFGTGALRSRSRAAQQALNRAATQYRSTVMAALQDVYDTLNVIQADTRALNAAEQVARSASETGEQTRKRYEAGSVDFPTMRIAQQTEQLATINLAQAQANRLGDTVALFHALGGRWWKQEETDKTKAKQP
ncbi:MAG: efflux transporter outer membrane subunit [Sideroxyarcus sp.]